MTYCSITACPCIVDVKAGPCKGAFNRYYYDQVTKQCKLFSWGGCEPNANNFLTLEACQNACPTQESK
jgi:hypothetical protein